MRQTTEMRVNELSDVEASLETFAIHRCRVATKNEKGVEIACNKSGGA